MKPFHFHNSPVVYIFIGDIYHSHLIDEDTEFDRNILSKVTRTLGDTRHTGKRLLLSRFSCVRLCATP